MPKKKSEEEKAKAVQEAMEEDAEEDSESPEGETEEASDAGEKKEEASDEGKEEEAGSKEKEKDIFEEAFGKKEEPEEVDGFPAKMPEKKQGKRVRTIRKDIGEIEITKPKPRKPKPEKIKKGTERFETHDTEITRPKRKPKKEEKPKKGVEVIQLKETEITKPKKPAEAAVAKEIEELEKEFGTREKGVSEKETEQELEEESEGEKPSEEIRKELLGKAEKESVREQHATGVALKFLEDSEKGNAFIGRKKSVFAKYGYEGALYLGKVAEPEQNGKNIYLDSLNPHVIFVCGARGSGKSYVLGVIAEELAKKNSQIGVIVIDPIGVFWSMRFPNKEEKEVSAMPQWNLFPQGVENLKVFVPEGIKSQIPNTTFDSTFTMQPSLLTPEDWCLTFGIDRFSPTGLLVDKVLKKVEHGFKTEDGKYEKAKKGIYGLDDLIYCLETEAEINSKDKGYKQDSVRALVSRFEAAKTWGIFSEKGTPLSELSRQNQLTILDTSFLEDNVTALVIGILARRLLAARKISTRKEAAKKFKELAVEQLLELEVPPTWLFIDEAHTLIPSGNVKTPATNGLVEYVKQGRRPGLSLVFATQQPSAIDTKVLSQLDLVLAHKLVFDDDIKAIFKRAPTIIPAKYKKPNFLKTLPIGVALTADRTEETSRAFVLSIRPRMSQHEGRDAETAPSEERLPQEQVEKLILGMLKSSLERSGKIEIEKIEQVVSTMNAKYAGKTQLSGMLDALEKYGARIDAETKTVLLPGRIEAEKTTVAESVEEAVEAIEQARESVSEMEETELVAIPAALTENIAKKIAEKNRQKGFLGIFGAKEQLKELKLKYRAVYRIEFQEFNKKNEFVSNSCFIDSVSGEFLHWKNNAFVESKGARSLYDLGQEEIALLSRLMQKKGQGQAAEDRQAKRLLDKLIEKGLLEKTEKDGKLQYSLKQEIDLPPSAMHEMLNSINKLRFVKVQAIEKQKELKNREQAIRLLHALWPNVMVKKISEINRPVYEALYEMQGKTRIITIDAVGGKLI